MADAVTVETIRGWLSTGFLGGNLFLLSRMVPAGLAYLKETREAKLADKKDDRAGWGELIDTMGKQITALTERERDCEARMTEMREAYEGRMLKMQGEIDGLRRLVVAKSTVEGVPLSPMTAAAAERSMGHLIERMDATANNP